MRRYIYLITILVTGLLALTSCNQIEENGRLTLGFDLLEEDLQKAASSEEYLTTALLTIVGEDGSLVYDKEPIELIHFGSSLVTRSLKLPVGEFLLTEFLLSDTMGMVLWATPKVGSTLAGLVQNPLPQSFRIQAEQSTRVSIQVVRVGKHTPEDFGYAQFNIDFVERFCLKVDFAMHSPACWNDSIMGPEGVMMPYYESRLMIYAGERLLLNERLEPGLNHFEIPLMSENYLLMATGCDHSTIFKQEFSMDELAKYRCQSDFPPLLIQDDEDTSIYITPEGLYVPTIRQGVFGQITPPLDSFMDSTLLDSDILVKDICFFPYHVLDSIYSFAPINCLIPYELIHMEPELVVRSNSEGFFQAELQQGEYLYMVKTEEGYYMDAFVSSHRPGYVKVSPGKVFELSIHLADCSMWM